MQFSSTASIGVLARCSVILDGRNQNHVRSSAAFGDIDDSFGKESPVCKRFLVSLVQLASIKALQMADTRCGHARWESSHNVLQQNRIRTGYPLTIANIYTQLIIFFVQLHRFH